jgi:hypothetical protein
MEDLLTVAAEIGDYEDLRGLAAYYRLRESGLRKRALAALDEFLAGTASWTETQRRAAADRIMAVSNRHPLPHVLPNPLLETIVVPALEQWMRDEPEAGAPRRWVGILRRDRTMLEDVLARDPDDHIARMALIEQMLSDVGHAAHQVAEGVFLGDVRDANVALDEAERQIALLSESVRRNDLQWWFNALFRLVGDWEEYQRERPAESFRTWCENIGFRHDWDEIAGYRRG